MDHSAHEPGTVEDCPECQALSYEPGWYKAMRDARVVGRDPSTVLVPEVEQADVEVGVPGSPEVRVPELEATKPDRPEP